jgi:hypothetical protein
VNLKPIKANMTELVLNNGKEGIRVLFSYSTPVAAVIFINGLAQAIKTEKKWSNTTTRHINEWAKDFPAYLNNWDTKPQEFFDNLIAEVK